MRKIFFISLLFVIFLFTILFFNCQQPSSSGGGGGSKLSSNANLSNLIISDGAIRALAPLFSSNTTTYGCIVFSNNITVTTTKEDAYASIQIRLNNGNWVGVISGTPYGLSLPFQMNHTIDIKVTAEDSSEKNYKVNVIRS